jgi:hypothetical protein
VDEHQDEVRLQNLAASPENTQQNASEPDTEYVGRLLIALADVRYQAQTLNEELTRVMKRLGLPLPSDSES